MYEFFQVIGLRKKLWDDGAMNDDLVPPDIPENAFIGSRSPADIVIGFKTVN